MTRAVVLRCRHGHLEGIPNGCASRGVVGCELRDDGSIAVDANQATTIDRVYAAGNCSDPKHNVPMAIADGARAAVAVNVRLVAEGVVQAHAAPLG